MPNSTTKLLKSKHSSWTSWARFVELPRIIIVTILRSWNHFPNYTIQPATTTTSSGNSTSQSSYGARRFGSPSRKSQSVRPKSRVSRYQINNLEQFAQTGDPQIFKSTVEDQAPKEIHRHGEELRMSTLELFPALRDIAGTSVAH